MFKTLEEGPLICSQSYNSIPSFPSRVSAKSLICWELLLGGGWRVWGIGWEKWQLQSDRFFPSLLSLCGAYLSTVPSPVTKPHAVLSSFPITIMNYLEWLTWDEQALVLAHRFGCFTPASVHGGDMWQSKTVAKRWARVRSPSPSRACPHWPKDLLALVS